MRSGSASRLREMRLEVNCGGRGTGGGRVSRTPVTFSRKAVFKTACFNHSHIPPHGDKRLFAHVYTSLRWQLYITQLHVRCTRHFPAPPLPRCDEDRRHHSWWVRWSVPALKIRALGYGACEIRRSLAQRLAVAQPARVSATRPAADDDVQPLIARTSNVGATHAALSPVRSSLAPFSPDL